MKLYKRVIKINGVRDSKEFEGLYTDITAAACIEARVFDLVGQEKGDVVHLLVLEGATGTGCQWHPVVKKSWALVDIHGWVWDNYYNWEQR